MYLELRPVSRPLRYGAEWDAYGLCDHRHWLSRTSDADITLNDRCEIVRQFLQTDPYHDRSHSDFREDNIERDGKRFVIFLLSQASSGQPGSAKPQTRTIFVPTPKKQGMSYVWKE